VATLHATVHALGAAINLKSMLFLLRHQI